MDELLKRLDRYLRNLRSEYYFELNPPLNDNEIDSLEEKFQIKLPVNLRTLYKWKNGQADDCYDAFVNNSMFVPLEQSLNIAKENTSMIGLDFEIDNWWSEKWIPIFHNGGGDFICYDTGGLFTGLCGQLIEFWHADNNRNVVASSLDIFIQALNNYFDTTIVSDFNEFFSIKKRIDNYPKTFKLT